MTLNGSTRASRKYFLYDSNSKVVDTLETQYKQKCRSAVIKKYKNQHFCFLDNRKKKLRYWYIL